MDSTLGLTFQTVSCVCLGSLLLLEWIVLRTLTHETILLKHLYEPSDTSVGPEDAVLGLLLQPFRARVLDSSYTLTEQDLLGQVTTLLFVQTESASQPRSMLTPLLHSLWHKRQGPLYVVCSGTLEHCQRLRDEYRLGKAHHSVIEVIFDEGGALRTTLVVTSELSAVVIGEDARVRKVGGVESDELIRAPHLEQGRESREQPSGT
jgi:hypothetical protein